MGQRDGFAASDISKIKQMYQCRGSFEPGPDAGSVVPETGPAVFPPSPVRPPSPGGGGFTNPWAQLIGGLGGFFHAIGGKHDEVDQDIVNSID